MKSVAIGKHIAPWGLAVVVGLSGGVWTLATAIAPQPAQAYTARASVTITRTGGESYQTLLQRAEAAARAAAQRTFDSDLLATDVSIIIVAQNNGASVPILTLEATRPQWSRRPDPRAWATYLPNAEVLLGFRTPEPAAPAAQPAAPPSPQPGIIPGQVVPFPGQVEGVPVQPGAIPVQPGAIPVQPGCDPRSTQWHPSTARCGSRTTRSSGSSAGSSSGSSSPPTNYSLAESTRTGCRRISLSRGRLSSGSVRRGAETTLGLDGGGCP
ncbi:hypothetical protein [Geitlerinema calcuttense]|uniref:Uncharacterized protein n=1 Tax=Geitlerinema calcuttense NRMC-F 0142 TaxID=2922238 RepID=A0ABT7M0Y6_9CYAN|nr:hypothetical protein [Geitlerinema calcuttense]MDL5057285.1 hypothetical protein [Geitlerinema calcuttense NRMC-F 0142]